MAVSPHPLRVIGSMQATIARRSLESGKESVAGPLEDMVVPAEGGESRPDVVVLAVDDRLREKVGGD